MVRIFIFFYHLREGSKSLIFLLSRKMISIFSRYGGGDKQGSAGLGGVGKGRVG